MSKREEVFAQQDSQKVYEFSMSFTVVLQIIGCILICVQWICDMSHAIATAGCALFCASYLIRSRVRCEVGEKRRTSDWVSFYMFAVLAILHLFSFASSIPM